MKNLRKIICAVMIFGFGVMSAQDLSEIINDEKTTIVDVRSPEEYDAGTANNAINIPIDQMGNRWGELQGKGNIVVFCRIGRRAGMAEEILKKHGIKVHNAKTLDNVKTLQKVNILKKISFGEKPSIHIIKKDKNMKQVAIGLGKGGILVKHTTDDPASLIVMKGCIQFIINGEKIILNEMDTYQIPINIEHEVIGLEKENVFIITKGKW